MARTLLVASTYQNGRDVDPDAEKTASATHMLDSNVLKKRDGSKFEALLESVQETSFTAHIVGDGVSFRQIVVAPVVNKDDGAVVIRPRKGNLLNFLIERSNGQLLYLRLIDEIPARLDLNGFIKTIEAVLPVCIEACTDIHELEASISTSVGGSVTLEELSLDSQTPAFYTNAIPELAESLINSAIKKNRRKATLEIEGVTGTIQPGEKAAYDDALAAFQAGQLKKADAGFTAFVRKYNASPYLPLALYWLGNTKYALKEYPGAIIQLQALIKTYPKHPRIPAAMLTLGNCQLESGNKTAARKTYGDLIANYPDTEVAVEARQMLPRTK